MNFIFMNFQEKAVELQHAQQILGLLTIVVTTAIMICHIQGTLFLSKYLYISLFINFVLIRIVKALMKKLSGKLREFTRHQSRWISPPGSQSMRKLMSSALVA